MDRIANHCQGWMDELLHAERARIRRDLEMIEVPPRDWLPAAPGLLDVVVVGAGLSGLAIAFGLIRQGIRRLLVLDRAPRGREGPWRSYATMDILRSPKTLTGPDLGLPSLTFRAWFEARRGTTAWENLGKIAREDWADYLLWYRDVLDLPVRNDTTLHGFAPDGGALALDIEGPDGRETLRTRRLVLATGIDGNGRPHVPDAVRALPPDRWCHSAAPFEGTQLRGQRVVVIGAAASAFDCAVSALRHGAASVQLLARRAALPHAEALAWANFPGFMAGLAELDDARRWRFMRRFFELQTPPTAEAFGEATSDPRFRLHLGAPLRSVRMAGDSLVVETGSASFRADLLMLGTGFEVALEARPELAPHAPLIARWADRHAPAVGEEWPALAAHPYLGPAFEFTEREPGTAPWLARVHNFNNGAVASLGPVCNGITGLKHGVPRLVSGVARALFVEDSDRHFADLLAYDEGVRLIPQEEP
jgi:cation diffusion facilitator CzcD-associated flavoprotein CzcO